MKVTRDESFDAVLFMRGPVRDADVAAGPDGAQTVIFTIGDVESSVQAHASPTQARNLAYRLAVVAAEVDGKPVQGHAQEKPRDYDLIVAQAFSAGAKQQEAWQQEGYPVGPLERAHAARNYALAAFAPEPLPEPSP